MKGILRNSLICFLLAFSLVEAKEELTGERLVFSIPSGYVLRHDQKTEKGGIMTFIPSGEDVDKWTEMIKVNVQYQSLDNEKVFAAMAFLNKEMCKEGAIYDLLTKEVNGYPTKYYMLSCPTNRQTDMGEVTLVKTVQGKDRFYIVQKLWRMKKYKAEAGILSKEQIAYWGEYFSTIYVCDDRDMKRKCPPRK